MPTSATGNKSRRSENGFTLIELMLVLAIIGIATAAMILSMPPSGGRVWTEAEALAARAIAARDDAIIQSRDMSIWVNAQGYGAARRRRGEWQDIGERPFQPASWKPGTTAVVDASGVQRVVFDTTGAVTTPVTFTLVRNAERATVTISGAGVIRVGT